MGKANSFVIDIAQHIAAWDNANIAIPASQTGFALLVAGLLLGSILYGPARWLAALPVAIGAVLTANTIPPTLLIAPDGKTLFWSNGRTAIMTGQKQGSFVTDQWKAALGLSSKAVIAATDPSLQCDPLACIIILPAGHILSHVHQPDAFETDCRRADLVITPFAAPSWCKPGKGLMDAHYFKQHGATALLETADTIQFRSARQTGEARPWQGDPDASNQ